MDKNCPFCNLEPDRIISESDYTVTIRDGFPISEGHTQRRVHQCRSASAR
jgi:diadenosine tetraphosphate (Ap4A) HIT family hydrolase